MVKNSAALGRTGLQDWCLQRLTAIFLAVYLLYMMAFFSSHEALTFEHWHALFKNSLMKLSTIAILFALIIHVWIGIWTVITDYLKPLWLRLTVVALLPCVLLTYTLWAIHILWGLS